MADQEIIEVVQAHMRGEKIDCQYVDQVCGWTTIQDEPVWNFARFNYRVAPKPKKKVVLYQWLMRSTSSGCWLSAQQEIAPYGAIRRLDETKIEIEVEE